MAVELGRQAETSVVGQPARDTEMGKPVGSRPVWGEIELAESYLVCSMFEEAASSASSVLKRLCEKEGIADDIEVNDMLESAGMVFVQSLKELGRTLEIISELTQLFDSLAAIPLQVFLAGACFHMQEDPNGTQKYLEEFLSKWRLIDQKYYILASLETNNTSSIKGSHNRFILEIDTYLKVVELYITLLKSTLKPTNLAISWVEKASLPELIRQEYLRRLQSKDTGSEASTSALATDGNVTLKSSKTSESAKEIDDKQAVLRNFGRNVPTLWWFRTFNLKFGGVRFAVSNGSMLLATLMLIAYYYFVRRRKYTIISILKGQALFVKKCIMDLWQLAFSYQVNPLAAVEPLQNPTRMTR